MMICCKVQESVCRSGLSSKILRNDPLRLSSTRRILHHRTMQRLLMTETIISLTSIPSRLDQMGPVVECLRRQTAEISSIILWLPKTYRRPEFRDTAIPKPPKGVEVRISDEDFGPATKVLPAVQAFEGQNVRIIYCDDDELYQPDWAETLINASNVHPNACVCVNGLTVSWIENLATSRRARFRLMNALTLGVTGRRFRRARPKKRPGIGRVDIAQGFGGVLVRPDFFGSAVYDIPDVLWTVDDTWLSGHLATQGVPIERVAARKMCKKAASASVSALKDYSYANYDRVEADYLCVEWYREHFGIWRQTSASSNSFDQA